MKTTFDIPAPLLHDVQQLARDRKTTTKSLVEQALRRLLDEQASDKPFVLRDGSFKGGGGLTPEFENASFQEILDASYGLEDRSEVIAVDTNVLVYAHRPEYAHHRRARELITELAEGTGLWAIPWPCLHEFYAVVTHPRIHRPPTTPAQAWKQIDNWRAAPRLSLLAESPGHADRLRSFTQPADIRGGRVHDARIAAICVDHGVTELVTMDRDFTRLPALRTRSLLD